MERRKRKSARISIDEVERVLFSGGQVLGDYFLVNRMVHYWGGSLGREMAFFYIIEEDALGEACEIYLRKHGVVEYASPTDVPKTRPA